MKRPSTAATTKEPNGSFVTFGRKKKILDMQLSKITLPATEQPISTVGQLDDYISFLVHSDNCECVDSLMRYACIDGYKYPASAAPKVDDDGWRTLNRARMLDDDSVVWLNSLPIQTQAFLVDLAEEIFFAVPKESVAANV